MRGKGFWAHGEGVVVGAALVEGVGVVMHARLRFGLDAGGGRREEREERRWRGAAGVGAVVLDLGRFQFKQFLRLCSASRCGCACAAFHVSCGAADGDTTGSGGGEGSVRPNTNTRRGGAHREEDTTRARARLHARLPARKQRPPSGPFR